MNARRFLLAVGTAVTGLGLLMAMVPQLAAAYPTQEAFVVLVGLVALGGAVATMSRRRDAEFDRVETGDPETLIELPAPGDEASRSFERASALKLTDTREKVEDRLRNAAVDVIRRRYDCSTGEAREMLASGEWTDDEHAAAFLSDGVTPPRIPPQLWVRIDSAFTFRARRTVDALVDLAGMEVDE
jgi:hypothetical protein